MSPANDFFKDRPILGYVITLTIGLITVFTANALTKDDLNKREVTKEINSKVDHIEFSEYKKEAKKYTDSRFEQHTLTEQRAFNSLEKLMESYLEGQKSLIQSIDSRLKRIEDNQ